MRVFIIIISSVVIIFYCFLHKIAGNANGKNQKEGTLGELDDFLFQEMPLNHSINIKHARLNASIPSRYFN